MAKTILPLSVSPKTADIALNGEALELNPFANAGITAADAPVLLALGLVIPALALLYIRLTDVYDENNFVEIFT